MKKALFVVNPASAGGKPSDEWERFRRQWPDQILEDDIRVTKGSGHAREIAATARGYETLVAVGGDGTVSEVLSGIMEYGEPRSTVGIVPCGTGNDIARDVGIGNVGDAVSALRDGYAGSHDLIRIDCQVEGRVAHRYAYLSCNMAFAAAMLERLKPWMKRLLGPKMPYFLATLMELVSYRAPSMTLRWGEQEYRGRTWMVVVANAEWQAGGSMRLAPDARTDDGEFDVTIVPYQSRTELLCKLHKVRTGSHICEPNVHYFRARSLNVDSVPPAELAIDGDLFGTTPASLTLCPGAIKILSPSSPNRHPID